MQTGSSIQFLAERGSHAGRTEEAPAETAAQNSKQGRLCEFPLRRTAEAFWDAPRASPESWEFFRKLSGKAIIDFESIASPFCYARSDVLFGEGQEPREIQLLLEGRALLSIGASGGKRLILGVAGPGEIPGLSSAVSGCRYEMTAEAQRPCRVLLVGLPRFLEFLRRNPVAGQNVARQLCSAYKHTCEQLSTMGTGSTSTAKLAHLLLDWCEEGDETIRGSRIQCSLSHKEIGDCIGLSREQVTQSMNNFRNHGLVELHGLTFIVPSRRALAVFAGLGATPNPSRPAA